MAEATPQSLRRPRRHYHSQPATMAEAAETPLLPGLPDEISIWEILVRLAPKDLLRCRAVCPAWRRATSARDFLLSHHRRQPALPLLYGFENSDDFTVSYMDIIPFDHRPADKLQPVARIGDDCELYHLETCCDGLLVFSSDNGDYNTRFFISNPATRQFAPIPLVYASTVNYRFLGIYQHSPTGEYRLLFYMVDELESEDQDGPLVFTLGSGEPPRHLGPESLNEDDMTQYPMSFLFRGGLHWYMGDTIIVFDTTAESFREMRPPPIGPGFDYLFEIDDMLGLSRFNMASLFLDIWAMHDYEAEAWAKKYRVKMPVEEIGLVWMANDDWDMVVDSWDGDVRVLVKISNKLFQVDINGKLVTSFNHEELTYAQTYLKQSLVLHTFFPTLEGYAVNASPFV